MIQVGSPAPAFVLPDQDGRPVSLDGLRGRRVVLYFYPKDDTPGCTIEACDFSAGIGRFAALDAVVLGCSADDAESHRKFIAKHGLKIALLTDADRSVMKAYGAWGEKNLYGKTVEGVIRSTVVIDEQGVVAAHWPKVAVEGHVDAVAAKLSEMGGGAVAAPAPKPAKKRAQPAAKKPAAKAKAKPKPVAKAKAKAKPAAKAKAKTKAKAKPKVAAKKPAAKAAKKPARKVKVGAKRR